MIDKGQIIEKVKEHLKVVIGVVLIVIVGIFLLVKETQQSEPINSLGEFNESNVLSTKESITQSTQEKVSFVDLKGAVKKPGMYEITGNMRVQEVIDLAGGFLKEADVNRVNLSQILEDQMVVYIPKVGEKVEELDQVVGQEEGGGKATGNVKNEKSEEGKVNINTADVTELQQLNGIGQKKAEAIVQYREENGSFQKLEDLTQVKGVGEKTFDSLRESITIN